MKNWKHDIIVILAVITLAFAISACKVETDNTHTHDAGEWVTTLEATCTKAGTKELRCTVDGFVINTEAITQLGHDMGNWMATADENTEARMCARCSVKETRLTGTDRFTFKEIGIPATAYQISKGTAITGAIVIPDNYRPNATSEYLPVTTIGTSAFSDCANLTSVTIPASVTAIGSYAFNSCTSLISITIPENVTTIGGFAFHFCTSLTSVTIPASVTTIRYNPFQANLSLTSITVSDNNPNFMSEGGALYNKDKTTLIAYPSVTGSFTIPASVTAIDSYTFSHCTSLTSVTIPASVTTIGDHAFDYCKFTSVTIPESVTTIDGYAFLYCDNLTSITIPANVTNIGQGVFNLCTNLVSVTFNGTIASSGLNNNAFYFIGDLRDKFYETDAENGTPGTYTTTAPVGNSSVWTKQ